MYNRKPNRLKNCDYSAAGYYFVTLCVKDRINWFGKIVKDEMELNEYGKTIKDYWLLVPEHYNNIAIDVYIIMPNHIHGIIIINSNSVVGTEHCSVPTGNNHYGLLSKTIKSFKNVCTKHFRQQFNNNDFVWQRSFYDHIIRNEESLKKVREYIINNPLNWALDEENDER